MERRTLALAAALMMVAVAFGAFAAHGLKARLSPEALAQWRTGVDYQFVHALALVFLSIAHGGKPVRWTRLPAILFTVGIALFSGSLYLLSTRTLHGLDGITPVLGPITPVGGLCFIAGWAALLITALRKGAAC
jgi:uncharacterized membrane protein YgdD (TMEM256/DUF423 family)